jgi:hypothetical protein
LKNGCVASRKGLKSGLCPETLEMPFRRVQLDADDLLVRFVDAARGFPTLTVRRGVEERASATVGIFKLTAATRVDLVPDVRDDYVASSWSAYSCRQPVERRAERNSSLKWNAVKMGLKAASVQQRGTIRAKLAIVESTDPRIRHLLS